MNERVEALTIRFEQATTDLTATVENCSPAGWTRVPAGEQESVGALAHHIAAYLEPTFGFACALANGQPQPPVTWAMIDQANAEHVAAYANVTREEVLALLRAKSSLTADALRRLSDAQLDNSGIVLGKEMTVQGVIEDFVIGHVYTHLSGLKAAIKS